MRLCQRVLCSLTMRWWTSRRQCMGPSWSSKISHRCRPKWSLEQMGTFHLLDRSSCRTSLQNLRCVAAILPGKSAQEGQNTEMPCCCLAHASSEHDTASAACTSATAQQSVARSSAVKLEHPGYRKLAPGLLRSQQMCDWRWWMLLWPGRGGLAGQD